MIWIVLVVLCVVLVEIGLRLPFGAALRRLTSASGRAVRIMQSKSISDHWKEKAVGAYARQTFAASARLALCLLALAAAAWGLIWLAGAAMGQDMFGTLLTFPGLLVSVGVAGAYAFFRTRPRPTEGYTTLDKVLHRLALGRSSVAEMSFDMDQARGGVDADAATTGRHVFVAGLARAGTTVLMRRLHASGQFRSLTYRDMPFVLAPRLWSSLTGGSRQASRATERAHGDALTVSADSPEALDEVFWRVFEGDAYLQSDRLRPHTASAETRGKLRRYVGAILSGDGPDRYLSKNNNNILRLTSLAEAFPNAEILIPFRHPDDHAGSLLAQHRRFCDMHAKDGFARRYMTWLSHHEFGSDHRPFAMEALPEGDARTPEYWLTLWCDVYDWLLEHAPDRAHFVSYEALCEAPDVWDDLATALGIDPQVMSDGGFRKSAKRYETADDELLRQRAADIHSALLARATLT